MVNIIAKHVNKILSLNKNFTHAPEESGQVVAICLFTGRSPRHYSIHVSIIQLYDRWLVMTGLPLS